MSAGARHSYRVAYLAALDFVDAILSACTRVDIAGSLRRECLEVGDIEIVADPKMGEERADLFGGTRPVNLLEQRVAAIMRGGAITPHPTDPKNGERYKKLWLVSPGIQLDLFVVLAPAQWGPALLIRTGPAEFSKSMVTALHGKGLRCEDLQIKKELGGQVVPCPDERTFFKLVERPYMPPQIRG